MTFAFSFHTPPANAILNVQISYSSLQYCNIGTEPTKCTGNSAADYYYYYYYYYYSENAQETYLEAQHQRITENSHIEHCAHIMGSTDIKAPQTVTTKLLPHFTS
jgi:hypothetical protein